MEIERPLKSIGLASGMIREIISRTEVSVSLESDRDDLARRVAHAETMFDDIYRDFATLVAMTQLHSAQRTSIIGGTS